MIKSSRQLEIKYPTEILEYIKEMSELNRPVFVYGGKGRTRVLQHLFPEIKLYDSREILEPKSTSGFYAIKENELIFTEGVLTTAMKKGDKICFKNIDCNMNLLYFLRPVINGKNFVTATGEEIHTHSSFRIFFTSKEPLDVRNVAFAGPVQFRSIEVMKAFGDKQASVEKVMQFISENKQNTCLAEKVGGCDGVCSRDDFECTCTEFLCSRHFHLLVELYGILSYLSEDSTSNAYRMALYQASVNLFLKHESKQLAEMLYLRQPPLALPNMLFAKTQAVETALRSLMLNIRVRKPTLLVGETGAGKTALVQYLATHSEYFFNAKINLTTVNMSSDFDASDLMGGYHSIDFTKKISELYQKAKLCMPKAVDKRELLRRLIEQLKNEQSVKNKVNEKVLLSRTTEMNSVTNKTKESLSMLIEEALLLLKVLDKKVPFVFKEGLLVDAMKNGRWVLLDEINLCSEETLNLLESVSSKDTFFLFDSGDFLPVKIHADFMLFACMNPHGDFGKKRFDSTAFNRINFYDFSCRKSCVLAVVQSITRNTTAEDSRIAEFYHEFKAAVGRRELSNFVEPLISGRTLCRALKLAMQLGSTKDALFRAFSLLFFTQLDFSSRAQAVLLFKKHFETVPVMQNDQVEQEILSASNKFIVTPKVKIQLADVNLAIEAGLPVLLQGDTSTGKTSLVMALAAKHNRRVVRINNHNQTESSDYLGNYTTDEEGIRFREGPLISAMRRGHWVVLDELNLAPSDVLEVLNRLLDDNKELFVPELGETVKPHVNFRLFATQNVNYSGRHGLAKSFRNRFVEIFFYEKSEADIKEILEKSCGMPGSFSKLMLSIYAALKSERSLNSFISLRDLFKWARRGPRSYCELFEIGMDLIFSRQRTEEDRREVTNVFRKVFAERCLFEKKDFFEIYMTGNSAKEIAAVSECFFDSITEGFVLTRSYQRLISLMLKAWACYEPVLLIGETGIGKTRVCEIVARLCKNTLRSMNLHNGTESADFVGHPVLVDGSIQWRDGCLVEAMLVGNAFLLDEINLAEDAALERLNSVLEDSRTLFVPEIDREIRAHDRFRVVATMNPSGDFGKKELSPALRSRFTEIYFELENDEYHAVFDALVDKENLVDSEFFKNQFRLLQNVSIRKVELVSKHIKNIMNKTDTISNEIDTINSRVDTIDKLSNRIDKTNLSNKSTDLCSTLYYMNPLSNKEDVWSDVLELLGISTQTQYEFFENENVFGVFPYFLNKKRLFNKETAADFLFESKTTRMNLQRIARGLSLGKGILLQGEPGVGKTSIVTSIAHSVGVPVLRINLSEQTELSDLLGSYLPVGNTVSFVESQFVEYIRNGYWVILDEINLCTQSVIEGLNSMLDHRKSIQVDGCDVAVHENTRIFGTMNPANSINGRKVLPKSFLDRFVVVSMNTYTQADIQLILSKKYGESFLFNASLSLRGNIKFNETGECTKGTYEFYTDRYSSVGRTALQLKELPTDFVVLSSQVAQLEKLLRCFERKVPVVLTGCSGRNAMLRFAACLFRLNTVSVDCHRETDTGDLLGQYQKTENTEESSALFRWVDSALVTALIKGGLVVFNNPELVEKCIFDRLNSLFESDRSINVHEKGCDTLVNAHHTCRFVLCVDSLQALSPALLDRCVVIELSGTRTYLDLYKLFLCSSLNRKENTSNKNCFKKVKSGFSLLEKLLDDHTELFKDNLFVDLIGTNKEIEMNDLDLELKRFSYYNKLPVCLDRLVPIHNTINELEILKMFELKEELCVAYDKQLLDAYTTLSSFSTHSFKNLKEAVDQLVLRTTVPVLVKSLFVVSTRDYFNCNEIPQDLLALKIHMLESLKTRRLEDLSDLFYFSQNCSTMKELEWCEPDVFLFNIVLTENDPLLIVKAALISEKVQHENTIKKKISEIARELYKYGKGDLEGLLNELHNVSSVYADRIAVIEKRLKRDYRKFRELITDLSLCEYLNNREIRLFLEEFSDLCDYALIFMFKKRHECIKCSALDRNDAHSSKQISLRLIRGLSQEKLLKQEYAKYLYNQMNGIKQTSHALVLEAICFNDLHTELLIDQNTEILEFTEHEINECINNLFPLKTKALIVDKRTGRITIGVDLIHLFNKKMPVESLKNLSLFSTPETIINEIQEIQLQNEKTINQPLSEEALKFAETVKSLKSIEEAFKQLYKKETCFSYERNYLYFLYLKFNQLTVQGLEVFFMDCSVYEFLDRLFFSESYLKLKNVPVLYNTCLLFKSFEIEKMNARRVNEAKKKLLKEPRLYEQTISAYVDRFLYIPVLTVFKIVFDLPTACSCFDMTIPGNTSNKKYKELVDTLLSYLNLNGDENDCSKWLLLNKTITHSVINSICGEPVDKNELVSAFYYRTVQNCFSNSEIALAKLFNTVVSNANQSKYDVCTLNSCYRLCLVAIELNCVYFSYFAYLFASSFDESDQMEEGVGLKTGTGQNNMKDRDIQENDICDEFDDNKQENDKQEDALEMNNEGELHSASEQSEVESGVDEEENDDGVEESNDEHERKETGEKKEQEENSEKNNSEEKIEELNEESIEEEVIEESSYEKSSNKEELNMESNEEESNNESIEEEKRSNKESQDSDIYNYEYQQSSLNRNQTANQAEGYNRKVEGVGVEEDALKEGAGEECIDGEGDLEKEGRVFDRQVVFKKTTADCSRLSNLLRVVLESNKNSKYRGDYKTGKKLNLKRIVPYIASDFRRDRIWMRRARSDKKEYVIRIFIDNSKSMFDQTLVDTLASVYSSLEHSFSLLGIPIELYRFGKTLAKCTVEELKFDEDRTVLDWTDDFSDGINLVLTDGIFQNVGFAKKNFLVVMIDKGNVTKMSKVNVIENKVFIEKYLDTFVLKYCIVKKIEDLEKIFVNALAEIIKEENI